MIFKLKDYAELRNRDKNRNEERELEIARDLAGKLVARGYDLKSSPEANEAIFRWMAQYRMGYYDEGPMPSKGLIICGNPGTGKTVAAKCISYWCQIDMYTIKTLDEAWGHDPEDCKSTYSKVFDRESPVIIDDLGDEPRTKHYGNAPCVDFLLPQLYESWAEYGKLVIVTTNLKMNEAQGRTDSIFDIYGERIYSRFSEMFNVVKMVGADRRRAQ